MSEYKRLTTRREDGKAIYACSLRWEAEDEQTILDRLADLEDKIESGQWVESPCEEMYRVIPNTQSNDFNDETAYRVLKYKIIAISIDGKKYLVESAGWQGKQNQHWINASEFTTKSQAETRLKELKGEG